VIKIKEVVGRKKLIVLIDSGSTHSFLDENIAKELLCMLQTTIPLSVTVANGNKKISRYKCQGFTWKMQGYEFSANLRIPQLGGCQIVLEVDWMRKVSPLIFDFNTLEVTFEKRARRLTLTGCMEGGECKAISGSHLKKLFEQEEGAIAQLHSVYAIKVDEEYIEDGTAGAKDHQWFKLEATWHHRGVR